MSKPKVNLYLIDKSGTSPSFGVDETVEIDVITFEEINRVKSDYAYFLVENEGFEWSEILGMQLMKNGQYYNIEASILTSF